MIIELLNEVEFKLCQIALVNEARAAAAWKCCDEVRSALMAGDAATAALAGCRLGEHPAEIRKSRRQATPTKNFERHRAYFSERARGFSEGTAAKRAAKKLGVSVKAIQRAVG